MGWQDKYGGTKTFLENNSKDIPMGKTCDILPVNRAMTVSAHIPFKPEPASESLWFRPLFRQGFLHLERLLDLNEHLVKNPATDLKRRALENEILYLEEGCEMRTAVLGLLVHRLRTAPKMLSLRSVQQLERAVEETLRERMVVAYHDKSGFLLVKVRIVFFDFGVPSFTRIAVLLIASLLIFSRISAIAFSNEEWAELVEKAEKGDAETQWTVGCVYYDGLHRPKNDAQAAKWFLEAAMRGHTEAQIALGSCYELGEGVPKDTLTAYALYSVAGNKAAENKNLLAKQMTPKQIADGKERAKALQKEIAAFKKRPQDFKR